MKQGKTQDYAGWSWVSTDVYGLQTVATQLPHRRLMPGCADEQEHHYQQLTYKSKNSAAASSVFSWVWYSPDI